MFRRAQSAVAESREATWQTIAEDARRVGAAALRDTLRELVIMALVAGFVGGLAAAVLVSML